MRSVSNPFEDNRAWQQGIILVRLLFFFFFFFLFQDPKTNIIPISIMETFIKLSWLIPCCNCVISRCITHERQMGAWQSATLKSRCDHAAVFTETEVRQGKAVQSIPAIRRSIRHLEGAEAPIDMHGPYQCSPRSEGQTGHRPHIKVRLKPVTASHTVCLPIHCN